MEEYYNRQTYSRFKLQQETQARNAHTAVIKALKQWDSPSLCWATNSIPVSPCAAGISRKGENFLTQENGNQREEQQLKEPEFRRCAPRKKSEVN